jgi:hypothetical protein
MSILSIFAESRALQYLRAELPEDVRENIDELGGALAAGMVKAGINCEPNSTDLYIARRAHATGEKIISGRGNCHMVFGSDRPNSVVSGHGGQGADGCSAIDIVAGMLPDLKRDQIVDPNFTGDAARIYISQKTNIDKNFNLSAGHVGASEGDSAIGMKADSIRIIARKGIKLVTEGRGSRSPTSGDIKTTVGIDLIAGNDDGAQNNPILGGILTALGMPDDNPKIQPIPKGYNLQEALNDLVGLLDDLSGIVDTFVTYQMIFNLQASMHTHTGVGVGVIQTFPSPGFIINGCVKTLQELVNCKMPIYLHRVNTSLYRINNLTEQGNNWINSRFNRTN